MWAQVRADQAGLPLRVVPIPGQASVAAVVHRHACLLVAEQGHGERFYRSGALDRRLRTAPRMIELYQAGQRFGQCRWAGEPGRAVCIAFPDHAVQQLTQGRLKALGLSTQHEVVDARISGLALQLGAEVVHGLPNGRLHAQGLCLALVGLPADRPTSAAAHGPAAPAGPRTAPHRLNAAQIDRVVHLIETAPDAGLHVAPLAEAVGAPHTARLFVDLQGHGQRWVTQGRRTQRLRTAPRMVELIEAGLSIDHCRWQGEAGTAPVTITVTVTSSDGSTSLPLCVSPAKITYGGSGAVTAASSYSCQ